MTHTGTLLHDMSFKFPSAAIFFNHSPNLLIVACRDGIFLMDVITLSVHPLSDTPQGAFYWPHAASVGDNDNVVVVGSCTPYSVSGYDTASRKRKWIFPTTREVGAVCVHDAQVLVSVAYNPMLVLDLNTGTQIAEMHNAGRWIYGLGVIEGLCFIHSHLSHLSDLHISVHLAMLQHLLYKQVTSMHLPLEMWDWIAKYRV